jgi:hypothetical protein
MKIRINRFIILGVIIANAILSIWLGWYSAVIFISILAIWFGIILYKMGRFNNKIMLFLIIEVIFIWIAFSFAFWEIGESLGNCLVYSLQNLFHFTVISINDSFNQSIVYKILASLEGFIGYLLVVSGIVLVFSNQKK